MVLLALAIGVPSAFAGYDEVAGPARGDGVVAATSGAVVLAIGADTMKKGGNAIDTALTVCLAQVAQVAGSYVSYAGVLSLMYFDAATRKVYYLNAGFDTPRDETDASSIPVRASGRTALVPGFMAGVEAAHRRFGRLAFARLFDPAIAIAEKGVRIDPDLSAMFRQRRDVLTRLPGARHIFTKPGGGIYAEGDLFRQPELATTLRRVAGDGAAFMYSGDWAEHFVAAVQREGGKVNRRDLREYRAVWEEPVHTTFCEHRVYAPGFSSREGVNLIEALNLLEAAELNRHGHYAKSAESLFWLCQILGCQDLMWLSTDAARHAEGMDLSPAARVQKMTAAAIWRRMQNGSWRYGRKVVAPRGDHSDAVVAVDRWGNWAALTHTINTNLWGETGIFVDGVSVPDPAAMQRQQVREAGPGRRLPDTMGPVIVLNGGSPAFATSAIGSGLHEKTIQVLFNVLQFGMDAQSAIDAPYLLPREQGSDGPVARLIEGTFDKRLVDDLQALGQPVRVLGKSRLAEWGGWRGLVIGVRRDSATGMCLGVPARDAATVRMPD
jgi:gamma-glutamyltranspeptidase/glutathione hydrolase